MLRHVLVFVVFTGDFMPLGNPKPTEGINEQLAELPTRAWVYASLMIQHVCMHLERKLTGWIVGIKSSM